MTSATLILIILYHLLLSFIGTLENLASQSKARIENLFFDIQIRRKIKLGNILEKLTHRHNGRDQVRRFDKNQDDCENENSASTQFLQIQKNQLIYLPEQLQQTSNVLFVFGFNSANWDFNLIKLYSLPTLSDEIEIEPIVIKTPLHLVQTWCCSAIGYIEFSWWSNYFDSFLKAYKTSETKNSSPTNRLITLTKCRTQNFHRMTPSTVNFAALTLLKPNTRTRFTH